jgi:hypothetical protein
MSQCQQKYFCKDVATGRDAEHRACGPLLMAKLELAVDFNRGGLYERLGGFSCREMHDVPATKTNLGSFLFNQAPQRQDNRLVPLAVDNIL